MYNYDEDLVGNESRRKTRHREYVHHLMGSIMSIHVAFKGKKNSQNTKQGSRFCGLVVSSLRRHHPMTGAEVVVVKLRNRFRLCKLRCFLLHESDYAWQVELVISEHQMDRQQKCVPPVQHISHRPGYSIYPAFFLY